METLRERFDNYKTIWDELFAGDSTTPTLLASFATNPAIYAARVIARSDKDVHRFTYETMRRALVVLLALVPMERLPILMKPGLEAFFSMLLIMDARFPGIDYSYPELAQKKGCFLFVAIGLLGEMLYPVNMEQRSYFIDDLMINLCLEPEVTALMHELELHNQPMPKVTH